jgi:hypothetical protein
MDKTADTLQPWIDLEHPRIARVIENQIKTEMAHEPLAHQFSPYPAAAATNSGYFCRAESLFRQALVTAMSAPAFGKQGDADELPRKPAGVCATRCGTSADRQKTSLHETNSLERTVPQSLHYFLKLLQ